MQNEHINLWAGSEVMTWVLHHGLLISNFEEVIPNYSLSLFLVKSTNLNILNVSIPLGLDSPLIYTTPQYADECSYRILSPGGS